MTQAVLRVLVVNEFCGDVRVHGLDDRFPLGLLGKQWALRGRREHQDWVVACQQGWNRKLILR